MATLLVTTSAAAAPQAEPTGPAHDLVHSILSAHLVATPLWWTGPEGSEYNVPTHPVMMGARVDYLYRFGIFRAGGGLSYASVFSTADKLYWFHHELRILPAVSAAYTFNHGTEIAVTAGFGLAASWQRELNPEFCDPGLDCLWQGPRYNPYAELMASVAVPVAHLFDLSFRTGAAGTLFSRAHIEVPFELGVRKRW